MNGESLPKFTAAITN